MKYSDEILRDYLAEALPEALSQDIEDRLEWDEDLTQRLMALDPIAGTVRDAFERVPDPERLEKIAAQVTDAVGQANTRAAPVASAARPWWLAVAASFVAAMAVGWALWPAAPDWRLEVARYQALYVPETIAHIDSDPALLAEQLRRAEQAIGVSLPQEALAGLDGVDLRRAQVLGFEGGALIQIAFSDPQGHPIALCLMRGDDGTAGPATLAGLASHSWAAGGHQFLLIGGTDQGALSDLAERVKALGLGAA